MARKMYIYRADYNIGDEERVRFFYARNAKVGRALCKEFCSEDGKLASNLKLTKIGLMKDALDNPDGAEMEANEETMLVLKDFGRDQKFAEREEGGA